MKIQHINPKLFFCSLFVFSCSNPNIKTPTVSEINKYNIIDSASWLIGEWQNQTPEGIVKETWIKKNDSTYFGISFYIIGNDTVSNESILLEQNGNNLFYKPTVKNENHGQSVKFIKTKASQNQLVFENPRHDFPQKITYTKIAKDSLVAEISGLMNGKLNEIKYPMSRK